MPAIHRSRCFRNEKRNLPPSVFRRGQCYCGSAEDDYEKNDRLPEEACNVLCTAFPKEVCGGFEAIEVRSQ